MFKGLIGKPVLMDKLDAELLPKISQWIAEDTKRSQALKKARAEKKKKAKRA